MSFDIDATIDGMIGAASGVVAAEWGNVQGCVEQALRTQKAALADIALARLEGAIDDDDLQSQLADEAVALEAALLACQVRARVMAQQAANAAMDVLREAIRIAL